MRVPVRIELQPVSREVLPGELVRFEVVASGTPRVGASDLDYQWRKNGVALVEGEGVSGVHSRVLTLAAADPGEEGRAGSGGLYDVVVSNGGSTVSTVPARLTVKAPPVFERQVSAQRVNEGDGAFFNAKVRGTPPLSYQWYKDGVALAGGTSTSYAIAKVTGTEHAGVYTLVASNEFGQTARVGVFHRCRSPPLS